MDPLSEQLEYVETLNEIAVSRASNGRLPAVLVNDRRFIEILKILKMQDTYIRYLRTALERSIKVLEMMTDS